MLTCMNTYVTTAMQSSSTILQRSLKRLSGLKCWMTTPYLIKSLTLPKLQKCTLKARSISNAYKNTNMTSPTGSLLSWLPTQLSTQTIFNWNTLGCTVTRNTVRAHLLQPPPGVYINPLLTKEITIHKCLKLPSENQFQNPSSSAKHELYSCCLKVQSLRRTPF